MIQDRQLIATVELIEELGRRFEHFVFAGLKMDDYSDKATVTTLRYYGASTTCAGLASNLMFAIHNDFEKTAKDV